MISCPGISFDPESHVYRTDGGNPVLSVTTIIRRAGLSDPRFYSDEARDRGTAAHLAIQYINEGTLDDDTVHERILPYVLGYRRWLSQSGFVVEQAERIVHNPIYGYAGTVDIVGTLNGLPAVVDVKTGTMQPWTALQLAAYAEAIAPRKNILRFGLEIRQDSSYRFEQFAERTDFDVFAGACALVKWKERHGG